MKIIALSGLDGSGKAGILKALIENMQKNRRFKTISITNPDEKDQVGIFEDVLKIQMVYVSTIGDNTKSLSNSINKAKKIYHVDLFITICPTAEMQKLIIEEDHDAKFIETDKYNLQDWGEIPELNKSNIQNVYVDRVEQEI